MLFYRVGVIKLSGDARRIEQDWNILGAFERPSSETGQLSAPEMKILALLAEGPSNKGIGGRLHISFATVRTHLMHIYAKLHVRCRTEAAAKYLRSNPDNRLPRPVPARS